MNNQKTKMKIRAVIFDLDGTLLDTLEDIALSMNSSLISAGFPGHPVASYRRFIGAGIAMLAHRALPEDHRDERTIEQMVAAMLTTYGNHWADHTRPYPGIPKVLDALSSRAIPMAVLSNKIDRFTREIVAALLGDWKFAAVIGAQEALPAKPDPMGARLIAQRLGIEEQAFLYLGDSAIDMQTAVSAGMFPVGALWGFQSAGALRTAGARKLIQEPAELLKLI
jgi:phosphoglycolate phosphatase